MRTTLIVLTVLLGCALPLAAQYDPYGQAYRPSPEQRKAARDRLAGKFGPAVGPFVKRHGDVGLSALQRCGEEAGKRLLALDASGALDRLPADRLLALVAQHGDPLADWLSVHHTALADEAAQAAFCQSPMDFVYDLKDLKAEAEAVRQGRPGAAPVPATTSAPDTPRAGNTNMLAPGLLIVAGLVLALFAGKAWGRRSA